MPSQSTTETHSTTGITPAAPWRVRAFSVLPDWRLAVTFNDGTTGTVDLSALVHSPDAGIFSDLKSPDFFARATLEYGALSWPNGADLAPDAMYKEIRRGGVYCAQ